MKKNKASWTAEITTIFRAAETMQPEKIRIHYDPFAEKFLRKPFQYILKSRALTHLALWFAVERRFPGGIITIATRMRYVDDCLKSSMEDGIEQLVLLGAGYDSRAYRFDTRGSGITVFEVDHPLTQELKKEKIKRIMDGFQENVIYVPVDFEKESFETKLIQQGYNPDLKTLFIWEGVTKYLTRPAVDKILGFVAGNSRKGSSIVFDYLYRSMVEGCDPSGLVRKILKYQISKGEPYIFGLEPEEVEPFLLERGFRQIRNMTPGQMKKLYFNGDVRFRKVHPFWGVVQASI